MVFKILSVVALSLSGTAIAEPCCGGDNQNTNVNVNVHQEPQVKYRTVYKDKVIPVTTTITKIVPSVNSYTSTYIEKVVPVDKLKIITITKIKYKKSKPKRYYVHKYKDTAKKNYISLLAGKSNTDIYSDRIGEYEVHVKNKLTNDLGVSYQYRFDNNILLGGQGTWNRNYYLSLGFGF